MKIITPTEEYLPRQFRSWFVANGILRLKHDRHYLFGLSWEVLQCFEPDCGCRHYEVTFAPLPTIVLTYQWYRDNPSCPDVIANHAAERREED